jgi:hypothetical protein
LPLSESFAAARAEHGLVLVRPDTGETRRLADDTVPHGVWRIEGIGTDVPGARTSTASLVGTPGEAFGSGCYWSTDGECGGLFSCSGSIVVWETEGTSFSGSTSCQGGCPCGAVINGSVDVDGSISGTFRGVNCERSYEGSMTARLLE